MSNSSFSNKFALMAPILALFSLLLIATMVDAFPMFRHPVHHLANNNETPKEHRQHQRLFYAALQRAAQSNDADATMETINMLNNNNNNGEGEGGNDAVAHDSDSDADLGQRMRLNTGQWSWSEVHSVREEVYTFAFTYFGMVTVLMVCLLVLVSCCYMYDCLGCYEANWQKSSKGNHIFPIGNGQAIVIGGDGQTKRMNAEEGGAKGWSWKGKHSRRWSMV